MNPTTDTTTVPVTPVVPAVDNATPVDVANTPEAKAATEAENTGEDASEPAKEPVTVSPVEDETKESSPELVAQEAAASAPAVPAALPTILGAPVSPLEVKTALLDAHDSVVALASKITGDVALSVHEDLQDVLAKVEEVRQWLVTKLVDYDPALAGELGLAPKTK